MGIGHKGYAIKSLLFVCDDPEDLEELLQMACDHYNSTAAKDNKVQRTAIPGKPHPVYDDNYNTLKENFGDDADINKTVLKLKSLVGVE